MDKERQLVVVGVGRCTDRAHTVEQSRTPAGLLRRAAELAAADAGLPVAATLQDVVVVATVDAFFEERWKAKFGKRPYKNFPRTVAHEIGARDVRDEYCWRSLSGGNGPQVRHIPPRLAAPSSGSVAMCRC